MPSTLPEGEPAPVDGSLPADALVDAPTRPLGIYVHVPFCATRCGYCDFNTYTATELGGGATQASYADSVEAELDLAARVLGSAELSLRQIESPRQPDCFRATRRSDDGIEFSG